MANETCQKESTELRNFLLAQPQPLLAKIDYDVRKEVLQILGHNMHYKLGYLDSIPATIGLHVCTNVCMCVHGREEPLDVGAEGPNTQTCKQTNILTIMESSRERHFKILIFNLDPYGGLKDCSQNS